jgi:hypothetical protein
MTRNVLLNQIKAGAYERSLTVAGFPGIRATVTARRYRSRAPGVIR